MDYSFNADIATDYGVDAAVIIHNLYWWICKNIANEKHIYDGKAWTYNTIKAFSELFPFFSEKQIRRTLDKLKTQGAIVIGNFNKTKLDRTQWYSLSDKILAIYEKGKCISRKGQMGNCATDGDGEEESEDDDILTKIKEIDAKYIPFEEETNAIFEDINEETDWTMESEESGQKREEKGGKGGKNDKYFNGSIVNLSLITAKMHKNVQKGQMHFPKRANAIPEKGKCISRKGQMHFPKRANVPNINTNNKPISKSINQSKLNIYNNLSNIYPLPPVIDRGTDGLSTKNINSSTNKVESSGKVLWYLEWFRQKITEEGDSAVLATVGSRFLALVEEISFKPQISVNGNIVSNENILDSYVGLFCDTECADLLGAYEVIDSKVAQGIVKNKFNYTVSTLYNAARL